MILFCPNYQMQVIGHYAPCKYLKAFILLAISQIFYQYIFIFVARKNIHPVLYCKRNKIDSIRIMEFVFAAHCIADLSFSNILQCFYTFPTHLPASGYQSVRQCSSVAQIQCKQIVFEATGLINGIILLFFVFTKQSTDNISALAGFVLYDTA
jgi:hypothetical protein